MYQEKLETQAKTLAEKKENFEQLTAEEQCQVLMEILHFFQCNPVLSDLRLIGGVGQAGRFTLSFNATKQKGLTLVAQSVTGFFEKRIPLVPFGRP